MAQQRHGTSTTGTLEIVSTPLAGPPGGEASPNSQVAVVALSSLRVGNELGRGAFCEVFEAWSAHGGDGGEDRWALKRVRRDLRRGPQRDTALRDLRSEIAVLSRIARHEHVIRLVATGGAESKDDPTAFTFAVLERLNEAFPARHEKWRLARDKLVSPGLVATVSGLFGASCCASCERERKALWRAQIGAARDLASALAFLHDVAARPTHKVVYRDLKPSNLGFDGDRLVLFDFGLAKFLPIDPRAGRDRFCTTPETGSVRYMAPEVARGDAYDEACDIFSFAIVLWHVLALETPFAAMDPASHRRLVVLGGERPPIDPAWPEAVRDLLTAAWAARPDDRPSADALRDGLERQLRDDLGSLL